MQQIFVKKKIVGRGKVCPPSYKSEKEKLSESAFLKSKRILKEVRYFKTRAGAERFIARDLLKDPQSTWGKPWADKMTMSFAVYKYRNY